MLPIFRLEEGGKQGRVGDFQSWSGHLGLGYRAGEFPVRFGSAALQWRH
jgi:hypothetical protein